MIKVISMQTVVTEMWNFRKKRQVWITREAAERSNARMGITREAAHRVHALCVSAAAIASYSSSITFFRGSDTSK